MNGNLEQYKVFYHVAQSESITLAAEKLCISQPAVSQAVRQLEMALECKLFLRTSKGVRLTDTGQVLYRHVKRGLEDIWNGERLLRSMQNLEAGEVRIGASDMTLQFYLLPFLERFHESYPGIRVKVSNGPTPETLGFLHQGGIDFGVVSTPVEEKSGMAVWPVRKISNTFVAGDKFLDLRGKILDYSLLQSYPCIFLEGNTSTRRFLDDFLKRQGVVVDPEFQLATSDMIVQFAMRNLGIGCVVRDFACKELESGQLFELEFEIPMPDREICIVTDERNPLSPAGERLLALLKEQ